MRLGEYITARNHLFDEVAQPELHRLFQSVHGTGKLKMPSADTIKRRVLDLGQQAIDETRDMIRVWISVLACI